MGSHAFNGLLPPFPPIGLFKQNCLRLGGCSQAKPVIRVLARDAALLARESLAPPDSGLLRPKLHGACQPTPKGSGIFLITGTKVSYKYPLSLRSNRHSTITKSQPYRSFPYALELVRIAKGMAKPLIPLGEAIGKVLGRMRKLAAVGPALPIGSSRLRYACPRVRTD